MKIKNKLSNLAWSRLRNRGLLVAVGAAALLAAACADDDLATDKPNKHMGTTLAFNVSDVQMDALAQNATEQTRGLSMQPIPASYLAPHKIEATGSNPHDFCLIESTVEGLNPVKVDAKTRGTILTASTLGTFSSIGYRAASSAAASNPGTALLWFHGEKTNPDGTLVNRYDWDWPINVYGRFYAVSPEATATNGITLSPSNYVQVPYIDFEVKSNVIDQVDLMTACSGEVHYEHGNDPTSNLKFTHALAAVKFSIGSNLSPVIIKKIEVSGVKYKGRYKLPNKADGSDAAWTSVDNATTTMTLDGINVNAAEMPNTMLAGALNPATNPNNRPGRQNYTFLMIPQTLPAKGAANHAKVTIYYQEGPTTKHVSFPLCDADGSGSVWKANTTKEYKLTQRKSGWEYVLTVSPSLTFAYNATASQQYTIKSFRQGGGTQQAIPWKVIRYEEWDPTANGGVGEWRYRGMTKPTWLTTFDKIEGNGGTAADAGNAAVQTATLIDKLKAYNDILKNATPKGIGLPYNLANPNGNGAKNSIEESANSYLISAPGHYCIPLVYGNAVKYNHTNKNSFQSTAPVTRFMFRPDIVLHKFKDHADNDIEKAIIEEQTGLTPDGADVVWMDQPNLVHFDSSPITHENITIDGATHSVAFVNFEVKASDIHNGNAVIAVKHGNTILWSWHLWFDHADALDKVPVKNHDNVTFKFMRNTLGQMHTKISNTAYDVPRKVRITIEQQAVNDGRKENGTFVITQNPGSDCEDVVTLYQFGRKDALPGTDTFYPSNGYSFESDNNNKQGRSYGYAIQHPNNMFVASHRNGQDTFDWCSVGCFNAWSSNNNMTLVIPWRDDPVVKTIYDPCPAGFHVPERNAFSGFTQNGQNDGPINSEGEFNKGWNFKTNIGNSTLFFPICGSRDRFTGVLSSVGNVGFYWSAPTDRESDAYFLWVQQGRVRPASMFLRSEAVAIRPVADPKPSVKPKVPGSTEEGWEDGGDLDGGEYEL